MKDFFVSYTGKDVDRATWVAEVLESENYSVVIQEWDFRPGDNFVSKINESLNECEKMVIILSEDYLKSNWCEAEWTSKLNEQMKLNKRKIIPIRILPVELNGLLAPIVYIDIVDKSEADAKSSILNGIKDNVDRKSKNGFPSYFNVEHVQIDNDYYVKDSEIIYQKTCKSKILTKGFNSLHHRITWFADESIELLSLTEGVRIERLDLKDTNLNYNVIFDHQFECGEVVEYCVKAVLSNKNKHFKNFFSTEVITPIGELNIHLRLDKTSVNKYYTQKISNSPMNVRTEEPKELPLYNQVHWYIKKPELYFEYKIFWLA